MKSKLMVLAGILLLGLVVIAPANVNAQTEIWAEVSIDYIGVDATGATAFPAIHLTAVNGAFNNRYFRFAPTAAKEMLATALTAQSQGMNLTVRIKADGITIDVLWLKNN
jgi:hypothetical protein